jgi:hypothetical protein
MQRLELKTDEPEKELERKLKDPAVKKVFMIDSKTIVIFYKTKKK